MPGETGVLEKQKGGWDVAYIVSKGSSRRLSEGDGGRDSGGWGEKVGRLA